MNEEEALEMLKSLKFNWTIDLYKIPDMCDYFFNLQQQLRSYKQKEEKLREILKKHTPANEDIILYEIKQILEGDK